MERAVKVFAVRAVQTYCTHHISLRVTSATYEYVIVYLACTDNCKLKADVISVLNPKQFWHYAITWSCNAFLHQATSCSPHANLKRFGPLVARLPVSGCALLWSSRVLNFSERWMLNFCKDTMLLSMIAWVSTNIKITPEHATCMELPAMCRIALREGHVSGASPQRSLANLNAKELHGCPWVYSVDIGNPCTVNCSRCVIQRRWTWLIRKLVDAVRVIRFYQGSSLQNKTQQLETCLNIKHIKKRM